MVGPPRAYFEVPLRPITADERDPQDYIRFVYQVVVFQMLANTPDLMREAQDKLVRRLRAEFEGALVGYEENDQPLLFWRRPLKFTMEGGFARLDCRLVIPGYEFPAEARPDEYCKFPEVA